MGFALPNNEKNFGKQTCLTLTQASALNKQKSPLEAGFLSSCGTA